MEVNSESKPNESKKKMDLESRISWVKVVLILVKMGGKPFLKGK